MKVEVRWIDSASNNGWREMDTDIKPVKCRSVGHLVKKNKRRVVLVMSVATSKQYGESLVIPRACVTSIRKLT